MADPTTDPSLDSTRAVLAGVPPVQAPGQLRDQAFAKIMQMAAGARDQMLGISGGEMPTVASAATDINFQQPQTQQKVAAAPQQQQQQQPHKGTKAKKQAKAMLDEQQHLSPQARAAAEKFPSQLDPRLMALVYKMQPAEVGQFYTPNNYYEGNQLQGNAPASSFISPDEQVALENWLWENGLRTKEGKAITPATINLGLLTDQERALFEQRREQMRALRQEKANANK